MKWNHLPMDGGLYAQHPKMLDNFYKIFEIRAAFEAKKAKEQQTKSPGMMGGKKPSKGGRRRRR